MSPAKQLHIRLHPINGCFVNSCNVTEINHRSPCSCFGLATVLATASCSRFLLLQHRHFSTAAPILSSCSTNTFLLQHQHFYTAAPTLFYCSNYTFIQRHNSFILQHQNLSTASQTFLYFSANTFQYMQHLNFSTAATTLFYCGTNIFCFSTDTFYNKENTVRKWLNFYKAREMCFESCDDLAQP